MVHPALLLLMRPPRLPAVDWTDAPADLNGLVCFAERRNLLSTHVSSHFKRSPSKTKPFFGVSMQFGQAVSTTCYRAIVSSKSAQWRLSFTYGRKPISTRTFNISSPIRLKVDMSALTSRWRLLVAVVKIGEEMRALLHVRFQRYYMCSFTVKLDSK